VWLLINPFGAALATNQLAPHILIYEFAYISLSIFLATRSICVNAHCIRTCAGHVFTSPVHSQWVLNYIPAARARRANSAALCGSICMFAGDTINQITRAYSWCWIACSRPLCECGGGQQCMHILLCGCLALLIACLHTALKAEQHMSVCINLYIGAMVCV